MKILAVDTTTSSCSVAIIDDNATLAELTLHDRETHSRSLLKNIDEVLKQADLDILNIDSFAVATGPGSFTGLRIGLSTVKGLSAATGAPVIGVSSLKSLALGLSVYDKQICSIIDARKNEVYAAIYRAVDNGIETIVGECVVSPAVLAEKISDETLFAGTGVSVYRGLIEAAVGNNAFFCEEQYNHINAVNVGVLARITLKQGTFGTASIVPDYIRKSDAEIGLEKRLNSV